MMAPDQSPVLASPPLVRPMNGWTREALDLCGHRRSRPDSCSKKSTRARDLSAFAPGPTGGPCPRLSAATPAAATPVTEDARPFVAKFQALLCPVRPRFTDEAQRIFGNVSGGRIRSFAPMALVVIKLPRTGRWRQTAATANGFWARPLDHGFGPVLDLSATRPLGQSQDPSHPPHGTSTRIRGHVRACEDAGHPNTPVAVPGTLDITDRARGAGRWPPAGSRRRCSRFNHHDRRRALSATAYGSPT